MNQESASLAIEHEADIVRIRPLNVNAVQLTLLAPRLAETAQPGQFVNVKTPYMLRRPIGIMDADPASGQIDLGIRMVGKGTEWLAGCKIGETLSLLGPLGHGFDLSGWKRVITVGGGTGVFPLYFVQQACRRENIDAIAVCGYPSKQDSILTEEYASCGCQVLFASDAGDMDIAGHAAWALEHLLTDLEPEPETVIMSCGPKVMMQSVAELARRYKLACQVSLEERMACGIGVCLVCTCKTRDSRGQEQMSRCCSEGPVFAAEDVIW